MREYFEIVDIMAREVLDLEGKKTIEVEVSLDDGTVGRAVASAGMVDKKETSIAAQNVNTEIAEALIGMNALDQKYIDELLMEIDGDAGKRLGTNATIATSFACAKAAAQSAGLSLFNYLGGINVKKIPELLDASEERRGMKWYSTLSELMDDIGNYEILCAGKTEETIMAHVAVAVGAKKLVVTPIVENEINRIKEEIE